MRPLGLRDAEVINQRIEYAGNQTTLSRIENCIKYSLTAGAYLAATNKLVSWVVLKRYGGLGMLMTLPEYRGKGLAQAVVTSLCLKLLDSNISPFCYVSKENIASASLFEKLGFEVYKDCEMIWGQATKEC